MADDVTLPSYLDDQLDDQAILTRMLSNVPDDLDKSEGGFIWDALAPAAIELAQAAQWAQEVLRRGFAQTTFGEYLDLRAAEHGITRRAAVPATGTVTFTGTPGTVIPAGTVVGTSGTDGTEPVRFTTDEAAVIGQYGTVDVPITALSPGSAGNVPAGAISLFDLTLAGVTSVTNAQPTSGGTDEEDDATLLARYLQKVRNQPTGGNQADYVNWALSVPGVGGVAVVPCRDGPGTVSIAIIDNNKKPASQSLVDAVQDAIAPPWRHTVLATSMTQSGGGVSIDSTQADAGIPVVKMVYSTAGNGQLVDSSVRQILDRPGIWTARVTLKVDSTAGTADLIQIGAWDPVGKVWLKQSPSSSTDAVVTLKASDLTTSFGVHVVDFYWDGAKQVELHITRLQSDTSTTVWVEQVEYRSAFSKDTGDGKAPIGARVTVGPAKAVPINVSGQMLVQDGYNAETVRSAAEQAIVTYLQSIALQEDNDVRYVRVANAILDTQGVMDCVNLTLNGDTANIPIDVQEVAVLGQVTWT